MTKTEHTIDMLRRKDGASLAEIMDALGWQEHSVRALLSATIAKKMNLPLIKSSGTWRADALLHRRGSHATPSWLRSKP